MGTDCRKAVRFDKYSSMRVKIGVKLKAFIKEYGAFDKGEEEGSKGLTKGYREPSSVRFGATCRPQNRG